MSKIMRVGGRDPNGNAKGFRTDVDGNLWAQPTVRNTIQTVFDSQVEANSQSSTITVPYEGQVETWVLVTTDKANWNLTRVGSRWSTGGATERGFYPIRDGDDKTWTETSPARSLAVLPYSLQDVEQEWLDPKNILEAMALKDFGILSMRYQNNSIETANVKIKVMKVWR